MRACLTFYAIVIQVLRFWHTTSSYSLRLRSGITACPLIHLAPQQNASSCSLWNTEVWQAVIQLNMTKCSYIINLHICVYIQDIKKKVINWKCTQIVSSRYANSWRKTNLWRPQLLQIINKYRCIHCILYGTCIMYIVFDYLTPHMPC